MNKNLPNQKRSRIVIMTLLCLFVFGFSLKAQLLNNYKKENESEQPAPKRESEPVMVEPSKKNKPKKNKSPKSDENSSYVGIYAGQRNFSNVPSDVFYLNQDSAYTNVDLGSGRPFIIGLQMMFQNADRGFAFPVQIEGFLGNSSGFTLNLGTGYKVGNQRFSFTPTVTAGLGRIWTSITTIELGDGVLPGGWFEPGSSVVFVGPTAENLDRGPGSNVSFTVGSLFFQAKASVNISFRVTEKLVLFADAGYNYVFSSTDNKFELSGEGYDNQQALLNPDGPPPNIVSIEPSGNNTLVNQRGATFKKTPYDLSGIQFQFGIGFSAGNK